MTVAQAMLIVSGLLLLTALTVGVAWCQPRLRRMRLRHFRHAHRQLLGMGIDIFRLSPEDWPDIFRRLEQLVAKEEGGLTYNWLKTVQLLAERCGLDPFFTAASQDQSAQAEYGRGSQCSSDVLPVALTEKGPSTDIYKSA